MMAKLILIIKLLLLVTLLVCQEVALTSAKGRPPKPQRTKGRGEISRMIEDQMEFFKLVAELGEQDFAPIPPLKDDPKTQIITMINAYMKSLNIPALSLGIVANGQVFMTQGFANPNFYSNPSAINADTNFNIGSCTKAFTSFLMGQLRDQGVVNFDVPVKNYFAKHFQMQSPITTLEVTLRDMMAHRTGLGDHTHDLAAMCRNDTNLGNLVYNLAYADPEYSIRFQWEYNNLMVATTGYLAGELTGQSWEQLVKNSIFTPLGMTNTFTRAADVMARGNFAQPYVTQAGGSMMLADLSIENLFNNEAPAGIISTTANDAVKWLQLHLNMGALPNGTSLISNTTLADIHSSSSSLYPTKLYSRFFSPAAKENITVNTDGYGLGWFTESYRGYRHVWHGGVLFGMNAQMSLLPSENIGVFIATNRDSVSGVLTNLARFVFDILLQQAPWLTPPALAKIAPKLKLQPPAILTDIALASRVTKPADNPVPLPLPFTSYVNNYVHPLYGTITVTPGSAPQTIAGSYQNCGTFSLTHLGNNIFSLIGFLYGSPAMTFDGQVVFQTNLNQQVDSLYIYYYNTSLPPVVYTNSYWMSRGTGY